MLTLVFYDFQLKIKVARPARDPMTIPIIVPIFKTESAVCETEE
jgi:hypothetical protein